MKMYVFHPMTDEYFGIITILDYEVSTRFVLRDYLVDNEALQGKHILVDFALKTGNNKYRFAEYTISKEGKIDFDSNKYVRPSLDVEKIANNYIKENKEILLNSVLPRSEIRKILDS